MRFSYLKSETVHYFSDGKTDYRRLGNGVWESRNGELWTAYSNCGDLENAYQAWLQAQS
ncbi:MAG: hypothetical protein QNJ46_13515 [Leptolyngbyaceae cyanobacterium MO_188.B28]|nr:hypothetical protein [Leptolyngbyaceae cyanobacterium MO_188.B28]